jgi:hypothetical protein
MLQATLQLLFHHLSRFLQNHLHHPRQLQLTNCRWLEQQIHLLQMRQSHHLSNP